MGTIFISHSSLDNDLAEDIVARLKQAGHTSVFLDFHPEDGIPPGRNWEQELYRRLRMCRAVIVLCTEHSMSSKWCFAEIAHARALGKPVIPLRADECEIDDLLKDRQILDLALDAEEAFGRLLKALEDRGLDPSGSFSWDSSRPPYPGLLPFQESEAATFLGREDAIRDGLAATNRLRDFMGANLLLVHGTSGAGKSSLVRAGLAPRLRRDKEQWLVIEPFRPLGDPLGEMAAMLQSFLKATQQEQSQEHDMSAVLQSVANLPSEEQAHQLANLGRDLRHAAQTPNARVVLVLDQLEELLTCGGNRLGPEQAFLKMFRALCECDAFLVIATLRSDFLGEFQGSEELRSLEFEALPLGPLSPGQLRQVIAGPAALAGFDIEPELVDALCADASGADALPLLAFALRELWERRSASGQMQLSTYRDAIGGLAGAIARRAEETLSSFSPTTAQEESLRISFLQMVHLNEEGEYARRGLLWGDIPRDAKPLLERFVRARLLVSHGDSKQSSIEVAHEAIFHAWGRLLQWLADGVDQLRSRTRLELATARWIAEDQHADFLLSAGRPLEEARSLLQAKDFAIGEDCRSFALRSIELRESQASTARAAETRRRRLASQLLGAMALLVALSALATYAFRQKGVAEGAQAEAVAAKERTESIRMAYEALILEAESPFGSQEALALALEAAARERMSGREVPAVGLKALMGSVEAEAAWQLLEGHSGVISSLSYSPDGQRLLTSSYDHTARLWSVVDAQEELVLDHKGAVYFARFSADGKQVLTASDGAAWLWDATTGIELQRFRIDGETVTHASFSPDGTRVATASEKEGLIRVWDINGGHLVSVFQGDSGLEEVRFSEDGLSILGGTRYGAGFQVWDVSSGDSIFLLQADGMGAGTIDRVASDFSPDGAIAVFLTDEFKVQLWSTTTGEMLYELPGNQDLQTFRFAPYGSRLLTIGMSQTSRIWDTSSGQILEELEVLEPFQEPMGYAGFANGDFSPTGSFGVLFDEDRGGLRLFSDNTGVGGVIKGPGIGEGFYSRSIVLFSPDGGSIATTLGPNARSIVLRRSIHWGEYLQKPIFQHEGSHSFSDVLYSPDGRSLLQVSGNRFTLWDDVSGRIVWDHEPAEEGNIKEVSFSPDGCILLVLYATGRGADLISVDSGQLLYSLGVEGEETLGVAFSPNSERALVTTEISDAWISDLKSGKQMVTLDGEHSTATCGAFSLDGSQVVTGHGDGNICIWNAASGKKLSRLEWHPSSVLQVAISEDGNRLVSSYEDGLLRIWDLSTGELIHDLRGYDGYGNPIDVVEFLPQGGLIAAGSRDNVVRIWDIQSGGLLDTFRTIEPVSGIRFSPDGLICIAVMDSGGQNWSFDSGLTLSAGFREIRSRSCFSPIHNASASYQSSDNPPSRTSWGAEAQMNRAWALLRDPSLLPPPIRAWLEQHTTKPQRRIGSFFGFPPLLIAAVTDNVRTARAILATDEPLWRQDSTGRRALHIAAFFGSVEVAKLLIEHGAELKVEDVSDKAALDYARENQHLELTRILEEAQESQK